MVPPSVCGDGALTEFDEPTITVRVNGVAVDVALPTVRLRPGGVGREREVDGLAGRGGRSRCRSAPPASVAVSRSSRCDGYSWSGAVNEPLADAANVCTGARGSCRRAVVHDRASSESADAGSVPCCGSVAEPEKAIDVADLPGRRGGGRDDRRRRAACCPTVIVDRVRVGRAVPDRSPGAARVYVPAGRVRAGRSRRRSSRRTAPSPSRSQA